MHVRSEFIWGIPAYDWMWEEEGKPMVRQSLRTIFPWGLCCVICLAYTKEAVPAPCSGSVIVYEDANFGGAASHEVKEPVRYVGDDWNDRISSIKIRGKQDWRFYQDWHFEGPFIDLKPGDYPFIPPEWNDRISSFTCLTKFD